jgi:hypothetical protein
MSAFATRPGPRVEDLWDAWRVAQAEVEIRYAAWRKIGAGGRPAAEAFVVYRAAMDREERAATLLGEALRHMAARGRPRAR